MNLPRTSPSTNSGIRVLMLDLWATVPYYTAYLAQALIRSGIQVQIASITYYLDRECFSRRGLELDPGLMDLVGRFSLPKYLRRPLKLLEGALNLGALALRFSVSAPDVVHVQYLPMLRWRLPIDLWFVRFCKWRGAEIVLTVHDLLPHDSGAKYRKLFASLYKRMDTLICHSSHIKDRLVREFDIPDANVAIIPHGPFFYDLPEADLTPTLATLGVDSGMGMVLWQGIIFPYKGVDLLLDAWRRVEEQTDALCLVVLGTGDARLTEALVRQAADLGLKRVRFNFRFASVEDLIAAYRAALMVVYPYRAITTSGALATGLALNKPIIATNLPVFREALTDDEDASLVAPDDPQALAAAVLRLFRDSNLRQRLATAVAARGVGERSWNDIAQSTTYVYHSLIARRARR